MLKNLTQKIVVVVLSLSCMLSYMPQVIFTSAVNSITYEAENAEMYGLTVNYDSAASGGKCVGDFSDDSNLIKFNVSVAKNGYYDIYISSKAMGEAKRNNLYVNGGSCGEFTSDSSDRFTETKMQYIYLNSGNNTVEIKKGWGWIYLDYIKITEKDPSDNSAFNVSKKLANPNASDPARRLMSFLVDNYGKNILTGQQADNGYSSDEVNAIYNATDKKPAVIGLDLLDYSPSSVRQHGSNGNSIEVAKNVYNAGGIVEMCWHWRMYDEYLKSGTDNGNPRWWCGFYTNNVDLSKFNFSSIMNDPNSYTYNQLVSDIDEIAGKLKILNDANIPVLFRPLHEASGGWFWWGSAGPEPYKKLWKLMYERLTNYHGLNNLIWVWTGLDAAWYPGDDYCDIVGMDIYNPSYDYSPMSSDFGKCVDFSAGKKLVTLSENGVIFDIDNALQANTLWSWFCVWNGDFAVSNYSLSTKYSEYYMWEKMYHHENAITLDELPDLRNYPINNSDNSSYQEPTDDSSAPDLGIERKYVPNNDTFRFVDKMGTGWNLGNTFDAYDNNLPGGANLSLEYAWCGTKTTKEQITALKNKGYSTIRIPVSWHNHVDSDFNIDQQWISRVKEVVNYAVDNGMYVILNIHHDNEYAFMFPDNDHLNSSKNYVSRIWKQVAGYFKDYDEHLIFETLNEPRLVGSTYEWWYNSSEYQCRASQECINQLNQTAVDTIRAAGGHNADRYIIVPAYCAKAQAAISDQFKLPNDKVSNKIIVSIHEYIPYNFAMNDPNDYASVRSFDMYGNDGKEIMSLMDTLYNKFVSNNIPVVITEFGARNKNDNNQDRANYAAYYYAAARSRGITCCWWDNNSTYSGEAFGIFNRSANNFYYPMIADASVLYGKSAGGFTEKDDSSSKSDSSSIDESSTPYVEGDPINIIDNQIQYDGDTWGQNEVSFNIPEDGKYKLEVKFQGNAGAYFKMKLDGVENRPFASGNWVNDTCGHDEWSEQFSKSEIMDMTAGTHTAEFEGNNCAKYTAFTATPVKDVIDDSSIIDDSSEDDTSSVVDSSSEDDTSSQTDSSSVIDESSSNDDSSEVDPIPVVRPKYIKSTISLEGVIGANLEYKISDTYVNGNYKIEVTAVSDKGDTKELTFDKNEKIGTNYKVVLPVTSSELTNVYDVTLAVKDASGNVITSVTNKVTVNATLNQMRSDEEVGPLARALQTYGTYAQKYFGVGTTDPTEEPDDISGITNEDLAAYKLSQQAVTTAKKVKFGTQSLLLEDQTTIRVTLASVPTTVDVNKLEMVYTGGGKEGRTEVKYDASTGKYYADISNISAQELSVMYSIHMEEAGEQVSNNLSYGAYSFIEANVSSNDVNYSNALKALYNYGEAAKAYFG